MTLIRLVPRPVEHEEVQEVKKVRPYTVLPIEDIAKYRADRKAFEEQWQLEYEKRAALRAKVSKEAVAEQNLELKFTDAEKAEIAFRGVHQIDPKPRVRNTLTKPAVNVTKPTMMERFKRLLITLLESAFEK
jgi:hypothetical protein